jgi:hypothetical protein
MFHENCQQQNGIPNFEKKILTKFFLFQVINRGKSGGGAGKLVWYVLGILWT